jgi:hypothetical protein
LETWYPSRRGGVVELVELSAVVLFDSVVFDAVFETEVLSAVFVVVLFETVFVTSAVVLAVFVAVLEIVDAGVRRYIHTATIMPMSITTAMIIPAISPARPREAAGFISRSGIGLQ